MAEGFQLDIVGIDEYLMNLRVISSLFGFQVAEKEVWRIDSKGFPSKMNSLKIQH
jgi:hypothetical protein